MGIDEFPSVLLKSGETAEEDDFIEVHIYGPLHRRNIEHMSIEQPATGADSAIMRGWKPN
jgi:hypothetical protein